MTNLVRRFVASRQARLACLGKGLLIACTIATLWPRVGFGQWVEKTVYLMDSMCGVAGSGAMVYDAVDDRVYVAGGDGDYSGTDSLGLQRIGQARVHSRFRTACRNQSERNPLAMRPGRGFDYASWVMVIDGSTGRKICRVPISGKYPIDICWAYKSDKLYVSDFLSSIVSIIDCRSNQLVATVGVGSMPDGLAYNPYNGKVYAANSDGGSVSVIDELSNQLVKTINLGRSPSLLLWDSLDNRLFAEAPDWASVTAIDGSSDSILGTVSVGGYPVWLAWNSSEDCIYLADQMNPSVAVVDCRQISVAATLRTDSYVHDMAWNAAQDRLYTCCDSSLMVFDGSSDSLIGRVQCGYWPSSPVWSSAFDRLYVMCGDPYSGYDTIRAIDGVTNQVVGQIGGWQGVGGKVVLGQHGHRLYASVWDGVACLALIDCAAESVLRLVQTMAYHPGCVLWNPDRNCFHVGTDEATILTFDGETDSLLWRKRVPYTTYNLALSPTNDKLYVETNHSLEVLNAGTGEWLRTIPGGGGLRGLLWNQVDDKLYATEGSYPYVMMAIRCRDDSVIRRFESLCPIGLAFSRSADKLYASMTSTDSLSVVDGAADTVVKVLGFAARAAHPIWADRPNVVFVACGDYRIRAIDCVGDSVIAAIAGFNPPNGPGIMCFNSTDDKLYSVVAGRVAIIDSGANLVSAWDSVSPGVWFWNRLSDKLYALDKDSFLAVVDGRTDSVLEKLRMDARPVRMGLNERSNRCYVSCEYGRTILVVRDSGAGIADPRSHEAVITGVPMEATPNPFAREVALRLPGQARAPATLSIYSSAGRLVRTLRTQSGVSVVWDARDNTGNVVTQGIYMAVLQETRKRVAVLKIVKAD